MSGYDGIARASAGPTEWSRPGAAPPEQVLYLCARECRGVAAEHVHAAALRAKHPQEFQASLQALVSL
jgi:hypothetical protein